MAPTPVTPPSQSPSPEIHEPYSSKMKVEEPGMACLAKQLSDLTTRMADLTTRLDQDKKDLEVRKNNEQPPKAKNQSAGPECLYGAPQKGNTYIIRTKDEPKALAIEHCALVVADEYRDAKTGEIDQTDRSFHWDCVQTKGWLGFRNIVTDTYLGINEKVHGNLTAEQKHHKAWEYIVPMMHPEGGYQLYCRHDNDLCLMGVEEKKRSKLVKVEHGKETLFSFVKVGDTI